MGLFGSNIKSLIEPNRQEAMFVGYLQCDYNRLYGMYIAVLLTNVFKIVKDTHTSNFSFNRHPALPQALGS